MPPPRILPGALVDLHARALVAICRADGLIDRAAGLALVERLEARSGHPVALADLLLAEPLEPAALEAVRRAPAGPFRGDGLHPRELVRLLAEDARAVLVVANGHLSEAEVHQLARLGLALGCTLDEVRALGADVAGHLVGGAPPGPAGGQTR